MNVTTKNISWIYLKFDKKKIVHINGIEHDTVKNNINLKPN